MHGSRAEVTGFHLKLPSHTPLHSTHFVPYALHTAAMSSTEQELACLHVDALTLHHRLELTAGCQEAAAKATARRAGVLAASMRRDAQAPIFGARTLKQKRKDEARAEEVARVTPNPVVRRGHWHQNVSGEGACTVGTVRAISTVSTSSVANMLTLLAASSGGSG